MIKVQGTSRVIIENVQPFVDNGLYPAKRAVGEQVDVTADILGDGHDHIRARVLFKKSTESNWRETEMISHGNDFWKGTFDTTEKGIYHFKITAWIDHFDTWYDGFKKKVAANVDVHLELKEGVVFLKTLETRKHRLSHAITRLEGNYDEAVAYVRSDEFTHLVHEHPLIDHETTTDRVFEVVVESKRVNFTAWYELFPRSASLENRHGTFRDVIKLLPRIEAMGFDVLYLPPIHPIGKDNRKGKNNTVKAEPGEPGSPWAIGSDEGGHKAILPALGTLNDYKMLITEAKSHGLDIALDLAFQCAPDHPYVKEHPDWFKQRPDGSIQYAENPPKKYQDIYPFNFECSDWQALWMELKSVITFWIDQGVTIFRVDNPHTKPTPFWQWVIGEVNKSYSDIIFLSEAFTRPRIMASLAKAGFTQGYTYFTWRVHKAEIMGYMNELVYGPSRNYFRPNFWPNTPDILPYHLQYQGENIFIMRYALAATLSSNYGMYGPAYELYDNQPLPGREEYLNSEKFEVKHYDWKRTTRLTDIVTMVNRARRENDALHSTWNIQFCNIENNFILAYLKATPDLSNIILVIVNLDPNGTQSGYVQLPKEKLKLGDLIHVRLRDLITEEVYTWTQEWNFVSLDPFKMPFHLFKVEIGDPFQ